MRNSEVEKVRSDSQTGARRHWTHQAFWLKEYRQVSSIMCQPCAAQTVQHRVNSCSFCQNCGTWHMWDMPWMIGKYSYLVFFAHTNVMSTWAPKPLGFNVMPRSLWPQPALEAGLQWFHSLPKERWNCIGDPWRCKRFFCHWVLRGDTFVVEICWGTLVTKMQTSTGWAKLFQ